MSGSLLGKNLTLLPETARESIVMGRFPDRVT